MMISAVLDACVLYSASLRDFFLWLAHFNQFRPHWSEEIHREWMRSLHANRSEMLWERLEYTRRQMDSEFPNSLVRGYESLMPTLQLPDPNDTHVLAVAIQAKAQYIVTFNLNDFLRRSHFCEDTRTVSDCSASMFPVKHAHLPIPRRLCTSVRKTLDNTRTVC